MPDAVGTTPFAYKTFILFCLVAFVTLVGTPLIGYLYGYTLFDWVRRHTVCVYRPGYHGRLSSPHFAPPSNVIRGSKLCCSSREAGHSRTPRFGGPPTTFATMLGRTRKKIPTTRKKDFGTATASGSSSTHDTARKITSASFAKTRWSCGNTGTITRS